MTSAERFADGIDAFIDFVGRITAWSSFALALVMSGNVLLRYVLHTGSVWSQELEWHLMVADLPVRHVLCVATRRACPR